jgi:hypothetical protein
MKNLAFSPAALLIRGLLITAALLSVSCDALNFSEEAFFIENTATTAARSVETEPGRVVIGDNGVLCMSNSPEDKVITIPLDNPGGLTIGEEGLVSGEWPAGVEVTARQSEDKKALMITVSGARRGQEFPLHLTLKTAKEGRSLGEQDLYIACVDFETRLADLTVSGRSFSFNPDVGEYVINDIPSSAVTLAYEKLNPDAEVSVSGGTAVNQETGQVELAVGTNQVSVRVQAAHGAASRDYTLHLTRLPSGIAKNISAFSLAGITVTPDDNPGRGRIDEAAGTITITVPYSADLGSLTPSITHSGVSISPPSAEARDFSNSENVPVLYTVTAENETSKTYAVSAARAAVSSIAIIKQPDKLVYAVGETLDISGMIVQSMDSTGHQSDITGECSAGTYDFTTPGMKYITITHSVSGETAILAPMVQMNSKEIISFTLEGRPGNISNTSTETGTITLTLPYGAALDGLRPVIVHNGTGIYPDPGAEQDFSGPVDYTVRAHDGTARTYTVTAVNAEILSIVVDVRPAKTSYKIGDTLDTTGIKIKGWDSAGTEHDISSGCVFGELDSEKPGTKSVSVTHTESGKTTTLALTVLMNSRAIKSFLLKERPGNISDTSSGTGTITLTLPYGAALNGLRPDIVHDGTGIYPDPGEEQDFSVPVDYTVSAEDGTTRTYTVTVTNAALSYIYVAKPPSKTVYLLNDGFDPSGMEIRGVDGIGYQFDISNSGCTFSYDFTTPGMTNVEITHTGSGKTTSLPVTVQDSSKEITSFILGGKTGTITHTGITGIITVELPYGAALNNLAPAITHNGFSISPASGAAQNFTVPVTYTVTSAGGTIRTYTVTASNATLFSIAVTAPPGRTLYGREAAANTGFDPAGMVIGGTDSQGNSILQAALGTISYSYNFTSTGTKQVTITAAGKQITQQVTVKDFSLLRSLTLRDHPLNLNPPFDPAVTSYEIWISFPHFVYSDTIYPTLMETDPELPSITSSPASFVNGQVFWAFQDGETLWITVTPAAGYGVPRTYTITARRQW